MNAERLPALYARLHDLAPAARRDLIEQVAAEDAALAGELELLLASTGETSPLDHSPWSRIDADAGPPMEEPLPDHVGPYRIQRELGRGGMGRVFLAEEETAEYRRPVALKVIRHPGFDEQALRRFRDEVRILASLEHPGIARFFDGGRAPDGTWFLALEYVEGEDLLRFVRRRGLGLRQRVELFVQVLDAVDFAHRRLVVHRDLKPGNVLVSAEGRAKLLDFGISKILDPEREDATRTEVHALTPAYASPEQLRGERVTIAADVYSLGVMLYELLAGRRPFARREAAGGDLVELSRAVLEGDPEPPSTAVRRASSAEEHAETPALLRWRDLAGDLDAITLKALRAEPESRYPSAAALAGDLRSWLAGKPVAARRGGRRYRLAKFVRRHRLPVGLAALVLVALAAGVAGTLVQSRRAARAATIAEAERDFALRQLSRAEAINELNAFLLTDAAPGGKPFTVGDLLARAERIVERQKAGPLRTEMMIAVGRALDNQDQLPEAKELLTAAYQQARAGEDATTRARAACALASAVARSGEPERGEALVAAGLARLSSEPLHVLSRIYCLQLGGEVAREGKQPELGLERTLAAQQLLRESGQGSALLEVRLASDLAESYRMAGRDREANLAFADAAARLEAVGYGDSETAGTLYNNWALAVRGQGNPLLAERLFRRAVGIASAKEGLDSVTPITLTNLGYVLSDLNRFEESQAFADRAFELAQRQGDARALMQALFLRARVRLRTGEVAAAAGLMAELERRVHELPADHPYHAVYESQMGLAAEARGDLAAALAAQDRAITMTGTDPARSFQVGFFLLRRAGLAQAAGRHAQARDDARRALALVGREVEPGAHSFWIGESRLALGRALRALGESEAAHRELTAALAHLEPTLGADHPDVRAARELALAAPAAQPAAR